MSFFKVSYLKIEKEFNFESYFIQKRWLLCFSLLFGITLYIFICGKLSLLVGRILSVKRWVESLTTHSICHLLTPSFRVPSYPNKQSVLNLVWMIDRWTLTNYFIFLFCVSLCFFSSFFPLLREARSLFSLFFVVMGNGSCYNKLSKSRRFSVWVLRLRINKCLKVINLLNRRKNLNSL